MLPFSAATRTANLTRMAEDRFDVLVIGGGITGVGIALDAAARGLADDLRSRATYRVGLTGYELLAAGRNIGYHRSVSANQVRAAIPGFGGRSRGLAYFESQVDDARLTIEVARAAQAFGAVLANHALVTRLLGDGRVTGAVVAEYAGTTDSPYTGDLDRPAVDAADRDYILSAVAQNFPGVTERDVVASWAGLRPLLSQDEELGETRTSDLSRNHAIFTDPPGLFTITGGKLTTYRAMAEDLVDRVAAALRDAGPGDAGPCRTRSIPLGLHGSPVAAVRLARAEVAGLGLPPRAAARLVQRYGDDWRQAIRMISEDRSLGEPVVGTLPVLGVEVALARSREMALTDEDDRCRAACAASPGRPNDRTKSHPEPAATTPSTASGATGRPPEIIPLTTSWTVPSPPAATR